MENYKQTVYEFEIGDETTARIVSDLIDRLMYGTNGEGRGRIPRILQISNHTKFLVRFDEMGKRKKL